jgi:hypothetical protein
MDGLDRWSTKRFEKKEGAAMLRASMLMVTLLVSSIAFAELAEDIVGTWTFADDEEGMAIVVTLNADGTFEMGIAIGGIVIPMEQGTYTLSGVELSLYFEGGEVETVEDVTIVGDQLSFYDPEEEETIIGVRGVPAFEPEGTGSISGTIRYDGEVSSGISVIAWVGETEEESRLAGIAVLTEAGAYTIAGLAPGSYMVMGILGLSWVFGEDDGDVHVWGAYGISEDLSDFDVDLVVVEEGAAVGSIDITLYDYGFFPGEEPSGVENRTWGALKAAF